MLLWVVWITLGSTKKLYHNHAKHDYLYAEERNKYIEERTTTKVGPNFNLNRLQPSPPKPIPTDQFGTNIQITEYI